jgi:phosphoribosylformylglycinamidine synthase
MILKLYKYLDFNITCFHIDIGDHLLHDSEKEIISKTLQAIENIHHKDEHYIEIGPKLDMITPWCSNALQVFHQLGFTWIHRIEHSKLFKKRGGDLPDIDPLLQTKYKEGEDINFNIRGKRERTKIILTQNIKKFSNKYGLGFDDHDIKYYQNLFSELGRNPTDVELFDLAQSNSEHSRHWFFSGKLFDHTGLPYDHTLFDLIKETFVKNPGNSIVAFKDNSSAIQGPKCKYLMPINPTEASPYYLKKNITLHPTFTAETHNFPTGVSPFPGAATGTGGRIRDMHSIGKGGLCIAGLVGYCVGNLHIPEFPLEWETESNNGSLEKALKILIEASNGASDYGNKFGEPVIGGFCRSFGQTMTKYTESGDYEDERIEWIKPIMFSAGIGQTIDHSLLKEDPMVEDYIIRIGGPAYKIGIGGGAASSRVDGGGKDVSAVQRGDAEMENKLNRVVRSCVERLDVNPIRSIHDQGAGGMGNVTKEIVSSLGGLVYLDKVVLGDKTMSSKEIWISEHQEQDTLICRGESDFKYISELCSRERLPVSCIGKVNNSGRIVAIDGGKKVVDLPLKTVLTGLPQKNYVLKRGWYKLRNIVHNGLRDETLEEALQRVFKNISVGSKRFLVNKVDRSVTGLVAQQQCVGITQVPISNYSLVAQSHFGYSGIASAVGEQPIKGLVCPDVSARLSVGEMLTNLMGCVISDFEDIKCSVNWMWPCNSEFERERMYQAVKAISEVFIELGIAVDGGKDSLSMVHGSSKSPGSVVVSAYVRCPDIRNKVDPGLIGSGTIYLVDLSGGKCRMGGSVYAQTLGQLGKVVPDMEDPMLVKKVFILIQNLIKKGFITALHDRSDGGLIGALSEMSFANQVGFKINLESYSKYCGVGSWESLLFNEELGVIIEVDNDKVKLIEKIFREGGLGSVLIKLGESCGSKIKVIHKNTLLINEMVNGLQLYWELCSMNLERYQTKLECVSDEYRSLHRRKIIDDMNCTFTIPNRVGCKRIPVCILREEGCNGDREMSAAFYHAGFRPWDISMSDLMKHDCSLDVLDQFRGIAFVGGFSYSDVFGAGRGWAASILYNERCKLIFKKFQERDDSFSLGVCNGCQTMSYLNFFNEKIRFVENQSGRFESRVVMVKIPDKCKSIMLRGLEGMTMNVWISHHEGRVIVPVSDNNIIALQYVDDSGKVTEEYPFNPNGSCNGIAGICSEDGRHFALMPHLERSFLNWQLPGTGERSRDLYSLWFKCFINAYEWCVGEH